MRQFTFLYLYCGQSCETCVSFQLYDCFKFSAVEEYVIHLGHNLLPMLACLKKIVCMAEDMRLNRLGTTHVL